MRVRMVSRPPSFQGLSEMHYNFLTVLVQMIEDKTFLKIPIAEFNSKGGQVNV